MDPSANSFNSLFMKASALDGASPLPVCCLHSALAAPRFIIAAGREGAPGLCLAPLPLSVRAPPLGHLYSNRQ